MDTLGVPERSFYRYLSQAFEHDRLLLAEQDKDKLVLELSILHDRLTNVYRRLVLIASNEDISAKDRISAEEEGYVRTCFYMSILGCRLGN